MGQVVRRRHREVGTSKLWFWLNCRLWLWWVDCRHRWGVLLEPRFGTGRGHVLCSHCAKSPSRSFASGAKESGGESAVGRAVVTPLPPCGRGCGLGRRLGWDRLGSSLGGGGAHRRPEQVS